MVMVSVAGEVTGAIKVSDTGGVTVRVTGEVTVC